MLFARLVPVTPSARLLFGESKKYLFFGKSKQYSSFSRQHGFSLLELIISAAVFSLVLISVLLAQQHNLRRLQKIFWRSLAVQQAYSFKQRFSINQGITRSREWAEWFARSSSLLPSFQATRECFIGGCHLSMKWLHSNTMTFNFSSSAVP